MDKMNEENKNNMCFDRRRHEGGKRNSRNVLFS